MQEQNQVQALPAEEVCGFELLPVEMLFRIFLPLLRPDGGVSSPERTRALLVEAFRGDNRLQRVVEVVRDMPVPLSWLDSVTHEDVLELLQLSSTWVAPQRLRAYDSLLPGVRIEVTAINIYRRMGHLRREVMNQACHRGWAYNQGSLVFRVWADQARLVEWIQPFNFPRFWWSHLEY